MLVSVTRRMAVVSKKGIVFPVGNYFNSEIPGDFKPLGAFAPIADGDCRPHQLVVAASANFSGIVVGGDEGLVGGG